MKALITIFLVALVIFYGCHSNSSALQPGANSSTEPLHIRTDLQHYFDECAVQGSIIIYDVQQQQWIASDSTGIHLATLPASTFKIINMLIALETGVIKDQHEVVKWVGSTDTVKYGYRPEIYHDMTVEEAFKESAGWVFIELAKKIGRTNYLKYLQASAYGNMNLSQQDPDFWNFGAFAVSPKNQAAFIKALYLDELPFSKRNMHIVKEVMQTEKTTTYTIYAKTGWTRDKQVNTGWWTGYVETGKGVCIFATRLLQDRKYNRSDFGSCRKEITKKVLKHLDILADTTSH